MKFVLVCGCVALVMASGCGSDSKASVASTTPATATTSTAAPSQTSSPMTVATVKVVPTTVSAPAVTAERTTAPPTSKVPTSTTIAEPTGADEYTPANPPSVIDQTHEILPDNSRPDGVYYATVSEGGEPAPADGSVVFELVQLFVGEKCIAHFGGDDADTCLNDYGVETDPTSYVEVPLTTQYITVVDPATQQSYQVSGAELYRLIQGEQPAEGAPPDYFYSGFGYFVTFVNGEVTRLEQWWTP